MTDKLHPAAGDGRPPLVQDDEKPSSDQTRAPGRAVPGDLVDEVGMGSFPASDPPGWWSGR
jgi:hypothetical protein